MPKKVYPEELKQFPLTFQIVIKMIFNRLLSGKNALITIVGQTGSGKSYAALMIKIGLFIYEHGHYPTVEEVMDTTIFKAKDLMRKLNDPDLKKYQAWLWDEAGIDVGNKNHASVQNRVIGWLVQTFRNLQQVVIFTIPSYGFLDAQVRKLLHYYIETMRIDQKNSECVAKPLRMQYNPRMDKVYFHNFKYPDGKGNTMEIDHMVIPKPPKEFCVEYEKVKSAFTSELNERIEVMLNKIDTDNGPKLTDNQKKIIDLLEQGITTHTKMAEIIGISAQAVGQNFRFIRNKGIDIDKYPKETPLPRV